jgi:uncharacterized surface protein with fasciclin (FAS1) repeats
MRKTVLAISTALVIGLSVAACGGDDDGETPAADTAAATAATAETGAAEPAPAAGDIVETAVAAGDFTTLAAALEAAGLVETLQGEGPFTVFAPTDEAFAALPEGTLDELLLPENREQLESILTYHVVEGAVPSSDLSDGQQVATLQGGELTIGVTDAGVTVDDATVTAADVAASNGVVHVVDTVLLPPE